MPQDIIEPNHSSSPDEVNLVKIMYFVALGIVVASLIPGLVALGMFAWIGLAIFAYLKRNDSASLMARSHYSNYLTVFWIGLVIYVICTLLNIFTLGIAIFVTVPILLIAAVWQLYRLIKGLTRVMDDRVYE